MSALLVQQPALALFLALALGHLIGKLRVGPIELGGICGTLIVALVLGLSGVRLSDDLKSIAFALFIFALGFTGGPQFFANVRKGWRFGLLSVVEVVAVMGVVIGATILLSLDAGAAAGLLAGSATESAVIGTATEAVASLPVPAAQVQSLQAQIATAYSITYLIGLITIVLFTSQLAPVLLRIDLKASAAQLAKSMGQSEVGGESALPDLVGRAFAAGGAAGLSVADFEAGRDGSVTIERIRRGEATIDPGPSERIQPGDVLLLVGHRAAVVQAAEGLGPEAASTNAIDLPLVHRAYVLKHKDVVGRTVADLRRLSPLDTRRGVYIRSIVRLEHAVPVLPETVLQSGDLVELYGPENAVSAAGQMLGQPAPPADKTDFVMLGLGVLAGILIGALGVTLGGVHVTLGTGGGCLLSGLVVGWYASRHTGFGAFPASAAQVLKDFGLATFIAAVGFSAGPDALRLIRQYGVWLPVAAVLAVLVPATLSLFIGRRFLKLDPPLLLGAIAGQQCSTPAISALITASGSSIPVVGYTVTYAISNVLLPLLGPVVVGLAFHLR